MTSTDADVEPDAGTLAEVEQLLQSDDTRRRALVVLVGDHLRDDDRTGSLVAELLDEDHFHVDAVITAPSEKSRVRQALETAVVGGADLVVTIGGVGVGPRDRVPEATRKVLDRRLVGIEEAVRSSGLAVGAFDAGLSRGLAGVSGSTVIVNLGDSRAAIRDGMATVLPMVHHVIMDLGRWRVQ
ncbi:molybdenum cofactor biosynthesis protein [Corynebacterium sp. TAE3-ERU12]|uniref:MogA/MoaB family molybdenum cofactor biosynthesis protein n=1 Tax=Corynebacterium sp. TAE3-ERU12 TaxID=2849491 RepID=UPI001C463B25|nr:molybdopterin-binding protein [Corynebacterium sp. TAE3-ERU12]MBV7295596.1 molybdenum cofactor biosynthesis protein [Corynebacterium sp. TAE3-ERU12]